jgi:hypothetical protein
MGKFVDQDGVCKPRRFEIASNNGKKIEKLTKGKTEI